MLKSLVGLVLAFGLSVQGMGFQAMMVPAGTAIRVAPRSYARVSAYCYQGDLPIPQAPWDALTLQRQDYDQFSQAVGEAYALFQVAEGDYARLSLQSAMERGLLTITGANTYSELLVFNNISAKVEIDFVTRVTLGPRSVALPDYVPRWDLIDWAQGVLQRAGCDPDLTQQTIWAIGTLQEVPEDLIRKAVPVIARALSSGPAPILWALNECAAGRTVTVGRLEHLIGTWLPPDEVRRIGEALSSLGYELQDVPTTYEREFVDHISRLTGEPPMEFAEPDGKTTPDFVLLRLRVEDTKVTPYILLVYRTGNEAAYSMTPLKPDGLDHARTLYAKGTIVEEREEALVLRREDFETGKTIGRTEIRFGLGEAPYSLIVEGQQIPLVLDASLSYLQFEDIARFQSLFGEAPHFRALLQHLSSDHLSDMVAISRLQGLEGTQWVYLSEVGPVAIAMAGARVHVCPVAGPEGLSAQLSRYAVAGQGGPEVFEQIPEGERLVIVNQGFPEWSSALSSHLRYTERWERVYVDEAPRLAWLNLLRMDEMTVEGNIGAVVDLLSLGKVGARQVGEAMLEGLRTSGIPRVDTLQNLEELDRSNVLIVTAHNDADLMNLLYDLGERDVLQGKVILLFVCQQDSPRQFIGNLVRQYGAVSVMAYPGLVSAQAVSYVVEQFVQVVQANPRFTAEEALWEALRRAESQAPDAKTDIKKMMDIFWHQISLEEAMAHYS